MSSQVEDHQVTSSLEGWTSRLDYYEHDIVIVTVFNKEQHASLN